MTAIITRIRKSYDLFTSRETRAEYHSQYNKYKKAPNCILKPHPILLTAFLSVTVDGVSRIPGTVSIFVQPVQNIEQQDIFSRQRMHLRRCSHTTVIRHSENNEGKIKMDNGCATRDGFRFFFKKHLFVDNGRVGGDILLWRGIGIMNKKFFVCLSVLFCFLLLLSCEKPKYVGEWYVGQESVSEIVEALTPEYLREYRNYHYGLVSQDTVAGLIEYKLMDSDEFDVLLDLKENGKCLISSQGSSQEAKYSVSKDNVLTLTADDESIEFGSFNSDFTRLSIDVYKDFLGFVIPLEKKTENSKELVYLWPEIEKGENASIETVKTLVMNGADVNYGVNDDEERLFFAAISEGCAEDIVLYLIENTDPKYINVCNEDSETALLEVLSHGEKASYNIVKALLDAGADISTGILRGYNPLQYAILCCSEEIALEVIAKADTEQINKLTYKMTCLGIALSRDKKASLAVVKALFDAGADITLGKSRDFDPLHYAIKYCSDEVALEVISQADAEQINTLNNDMTCLGIALSKGEKASVAVVKALFDGGADGSTGDGLELSAAAYAKKYCSEEISLLLRERGPASQGNFVRLDSEEFAIISEEELTGTYSNNDGVTDGILNFTIKITDNKTYFVLKENGEEKALSTIKSLSPRYNVKIEDIDDDYYFYDGYGVKNADSIFNIVEMNRGISAFVKEETVTITISNEYGTYNLGLINTSEIEGLRYNKGLYNEAMALIEKEQYKEAIEKLEGFKVSEPDSYKYYECDNKIKECKEALYQKALQAYMNGSYEVAMTLFEDCGNDYSEARKGIEQCKDALGILYVGKTVTFGKNPDTNEPVEWIVLEYDEEKMLVVSKYILFDMSMTDGYERTWTWETCKVRNYLNDTSDSGFLGSYFSLEEQNMIIPTTVVGDEESSITVDKIFLSTLSNIEDLMLVYQRYVYDLDHGWWLLSYWNSWYNHMSMNYIGYKNEWISGRGKYYSSSSNGVRPSMWITLDD